MYLTGRGDMQVQGALAGHAEYVRRYNFQCFTARSVRYTQVYSVLPSMTVLHSLSDTRDGVCRVFAQGGMGTFPWYT